MLTAHAFAQRDKKTHHITSHPSFSFTHVHSRTSTSLHLTSPHFTSLRPSVHSLLISNLPSSPEGFKTRKMKKIAPSNAKSFHPLLRGAQLEGFKRLKGSHAHTCTRSGSSQKSWTGGWSANVTKEEAGVVQGARRPCRRPHPVREARHGEGEQRAEPRQHHDAGAPPHQCMVQRLKSEGGTSEFGGGREAKPSALRVSFRRRSGSFNTYFVRVVRK